MKEHHYHCTLTEVSAEELLPVERQLIEYASASLKTAYAPYSKFYVGAALLLQNQKIICGSNQENAAYPSGLCAERVALFSAGAQYPGEVIQIIVITTANKINEPIAPCGACRQVLIEYELKQNTPIKLIMTNPSGKIFISESAENILPMVFKLMQ